MSDRKSFVYGIPVSDYNFAGREKEQQRLMADFSHGINVILISPRRMGKTSLVKRVCREMSEADILFVYIDIFGCKNEYEFLNKFAEAVLRQTASRREMWWEEVSVSLGITPKTHTPEEVLGLAEKIAERKGKRVVVCIDEFQQIGEMPDTVQIQARMRGLWQHHTHANYCLFGSKHHLMGSMFLNKSMPFYQFGDLIAIDKIDDSSWVDYLVSHFADIDITLSKDLALTLCRRVDSYSAYVQQLAWLVSISASKHSEITDKDVNKAFDELLITNDILFMQQVEPLSAYQMNFLRAVASGEHLNFTRASVRETFKLGSYSNVSRLKTALLDRDIIEQRKEGLYFTDPVLREWFIRKMM